MKVFTEEEAAKYYNSLPKKSMSAAVLIFRESDVLLVRPTYLDGWLWIGGNVEADESPAACAKREVLEEIGYDVKDASFGFMNYIPAQESGRQELVQCIFYTEVEPEFDVNCLKLQKDEIAEAKFVPIEDIHNYLNVIRATAVKTFYNNGKVTQYLESGERLSHA